MKKGFYGRPFLAPAAIFLTAFLAFGLTLKVGFLWDDHRMIETNPRMALSADNVSSAFKGDPFSQGLNYYRPLQTLSNMADFAAWGLRPFGYHLTNFLFHAATALLLFYLALALGFGRGASFWAAALLAAHPAAVEQMLVIAGRAELSSAACTAASLLLLLRGRTAASFLLFAAAAGFKENGIITPVLAALCFWYLRKPREEYRKLLPFLAFIPVYLLLRHSALGMGIFSHGAGAAAAGMFTKVPSALVAYFSDTALPFWMHSHRMQPDSALMSWTAPPLLAAAGALLWKKGSRTAVFCGAWYLLNFAPKLPLLAANDLMLNHWAYLSNAGLFLWLSASLERTRARVLLPAAAAALALISAFNITLRDTDLKIYEHAARSSSSKPMLHNLAREYYLAGDFTKSREIMEKISAEAPEDPLYLSSLGLARWMDGDAEGALKALDRALELRPGDAEILYNKYTVLLAQNRDAEAEKALDLLLVGRPDYAPALLILARSAAAEGRIPEAEASYRKVLGTNPYDTGALNDYGILLAGRGDYEGAEEMFRRALRTNPGLESASANLSRLRSINKKNTAP